MVFGVLQGGVGQVFELHLGAPEICRQLAAPENLRLAELVKVYCILSPANFFTMELALISVSHPPDTRARDFLEHAYSFRNLFARHF